VTSVGCQRFRYWLVTADNGSGRSRCVRKRLPLHGGRQALSRLTGDRLDQFGGRYDQASGTAGAIRRSRFGRSLWHPTP
jgi:hypothetical protein